MKANTHRETAGLIAGVVLVVAGLTLIIFARPWVFVHPADDGNFLEWVSTIGSRVYGVIALVLGGVVIWLVRSPWGQRNSTLDTYVWTLSQELLRHLGKRKYYAVEEVTRIADAAGCRMAYFAYAHAMFCSRSDFDAHYDTRLGPAAYDRLRGVIARRYFDGGRGFDAATVVRLGTPPREEEYSFYQGIDG